MLKLAGVGKCLRKFQLLRHTPMAGLPEFAAHPAVDPIHHHLQDWLNYPHVSSITQKKNMLKSLKRKIVLNFRATRTFIETHYQNIHPKNVGFLGGVFGGHPKPLSGRSSLWHHGTVWPSKVVLISHWRVPASFTLRCGRPWTGPGSDDWGGATCFFWDQTTQWENSVDYLDVYGLLIAIVQWQAVSFREGVIE